MDGNKKVRYFDLLYFFATLLTMLSLLVSNKLNSICIMALAVIWLAEGHLRQKVSDLKRAPFFVWNALFFTCYLVSILFSEDKHTALFFVEKKLSLVVLPAVFLSKPEFTAKQFRMLLRSFVAAVILLALLSFIIAIKAFVDTGDASLFFYHKLSEPLGFSAIVASLLSAIALVILLGERNWNKWTISAVAILCLWIIMLLSKLFLLVMLALLLVNVIFRLSMRYRLLAMACLLGLALLVTCFDNPVRRRFGDIFRFEPAYLSAAKYNPSYYFDGLSLRLVYVKFSMELMREHRFFLQGAGTGDAERLLRDKIIAYDMYTGNLPNREAGYLKYGFHNQYLQVLMQLGLSGFLLFAGTLVYCLYQGIYARNRMLLNLLLVFSLSFLTDTLAEHQVGLVSFLLFTCLAIKQVYQGQPARAT